MSAEDRIFWMTIRQALLLILDAVERRLEISPRTSELRKARHALSVAAEHDTVAA
jgi:hypothetical protein